MTDRQLETVFEGEGMTKQSLLKALENEETKYSGANVANAFKIAAVLVKEHLQEDEWQPIEIPVNIGSDALRIVNFLDMRCYLVISKLINMRWTWGPEAFLILRK